MTETFQGKHRCRVCGFEQDNRGYVDVSQPVPHTAEHLEDMRAEMDALRAAETLTPFLLTPEPIGMNSITQPSPILLNTVTQGNCLDLLPRVPSKSIDLVLTDIPYAEVNRASGGLRVLDKGAADTETFSLDALVGELARVTKGSVYLFCGIKQISPITELLQAQGMTTRLGVWHKTNPSPMNGQRLWLSGIEACVFGRFPHAAFNEHCKSAVWTAPSGRSKIHPTQKPLVLFERLVLASSNPGDIVLDACCGSGTTGVACQNTGRNFIQMELDPGYCEIARSRLKLLPDVLPVAA